MAIEDRELDEDLELPADDEEGETPDADEPELDDETGDAESDGETPDEEGELVVVIGDEAAEAEEVPASAPQWVKDLRKENRELKKQLRAGGTQQAVTAQKKDPGPKPKLADSDYDESRHEAALDAWYEAKREAEKAEREAADAQTAQQREWENQVQSHVKAKGALKAKDYDEVEETVFDQLDQTQQGIIISGAKNSALVVYALGKSKKTRDELAAIKDPVKFAFAIAKLETKLKTTTRRPASAPESTVDRANTGGARTSQATLDKLRAEAEKTGNYGKVAAYKRKMRERAAG